MQSNMKFDADKMTNFTHEILINFCFEKDNTNNKGNFDNHVNLSEDGYVGRDEGNEQREKALESVS